MGRKSNETKIRERLEIEKLMSRTLTDTSEEEFYDHAARALIAIREIAPKKRVYFLRTDSPGKEKYSDCIRDTTFSLFLNKPNLNSNTPIYIDNGPMQQDTMHHSLLEDMIIETRYIDNPRGLYIDFRERVSKIYDVAKSKGKKLYFPKGPAYEPGVYYYGSASAKDRSYKLYDF